MEIILKKKPQNPILIEGFPGFGLIGTITTEFLIDQLKAELIGIVKIKEAPAIVAIHEGKVVQPLGIFYSKKCNIVILHVITSVQGIEWDLADTIKDLAKRLKAKEIISLEGVASPLEAGESKTFYYTNRLERKSMFRSLKIDPLGEGIIIGVTGALMLESDKLPISCIFVEAHSNLPDSKASAKIIEVLDKVLKLKIDTEPLLEQAEKFEEKIKGLLQQSKMAAEQQQKKQMSYVG